MDQSILDTPVHDMPNAFPNMELANGATVLHYTELHPGGNGWKRNGLAVCYWTTNQEFVTWRVYTDDSNVWLAESGCYYPTLREAIQSYLERGGRIGMVDSSILEDVNE